MHREQSLRALIARPPFGYRTAECDGAWRLELDPEQAEIVREISERILAGESLTGIVNDLNRRAVPTPYDWNRQRGGRDPRGGRWTTDTLRAVLGPHLDGRHVVDGDGLPVLPAPAILAPETYAALETELHRRRSAPLHGIVRCGCGAALQLELVPGRPPQQCDYQCPVAGHLVIPAWWLEGDVEMVSVVNVGGWSLHSLAPAAAEPDGSAWQPTGDTFEHAWHAAAIQDKAAGSWARRRALLRMAGLTFSVEEETAGERSRLHGRLGIYRYTLHQGRAELPIGD